MSLIKQPIYVVSHLNQLGYSKQQLIVQNKHELESIKKFPVRRVASLNLYGASTPTPSLLEVLLRLQIPCHFFSLYGRYIARVSSAFGSEERSVIRIYEYLRSPVNKLALANFFIEHKFKAIIKFYSQLITNQTTSDEPLVRRHINILRGHLSSLQATKLNVNQLLGLEGANAQMYYQVLGSCIKDYDLRTNFSKRSRRPPTDCVNSLLSFTYSLLLAEVLATFHSLQIATSLGVLHSSSFKSKPALALDFMEEFRISIADRFILRLLNTHQVTADDFCYEREAVYLSASGRRNVSVKWLDYMNKVSVTQKHTARKKIFKSAHRLKRRIKSENL